MSWNKVKLSKFLKTREQRFKPNSIEIKGLKRIEKINYEGNIFLSDKPSNTDMIIIKNGDLVISGINVEKGAIAVYQGNEDVSATIHYSSYEYDPKEIDIDYLKIFLKSPEFLSAIKEQVPGGIKTEIKPKHLLPLEVFIPDINEQRTICKKYSEFEILNKNLSEQIEYQNDLLKKLRQAFLREAMQGKLVPQDPNDEPASELLKKINAEKAKLIAEGKLKKQKPLPEIKPEEIPYEIPKNWVWCRLGEIIEFISGNNFNSSDFTKGEGAKCIKITNAGVGEIIETDDVLPKSFLETFRSFLVFEGDVILALTRPYIADGLKVSKCPKSYNLSLLNQRVAVLRPSLNLSAEFIYNFLRSDFVLNIYKEMFSGKGQQPNLKKEHVTELLFPLPPLTEQQRIVSKLNELMQFCDQLGQNINTTKEQTNLLLQTVLREALEGKGKGIPIQ